MKTNFTRFSTEHIPAVAPWWWRSIGETCSSENRLFFICFQRENSWF